MKSGWPGARNSCGYCHAPSTYGTKPQHKKECKLVGGPDGKPWDVNCECGHWGAAHHIASLGNPGCPVEGCPCLKMYTAFGVETANAPVCDCGGAKLGYPPGTMHSFWNHPKDKSKWCPLRVEK